LPFHPIINFEVATKHKFGYNPEELEAVIQGNLTLSEKNVSKDLRTVMANVTNLQGEKVGFLKVDVRSTNKRGPSIFNSSQVLTQNPNKL
jgi:regulatory protein YycI of two-component signal transduction system YycFG